jgi:hypothetical protein
LELKGIELVFLQDHYLFYGLLNVKIADIFPELAATYLGKRQDVVHVVVQKLGSRVLDRKILLLFFEEVLKLFVSMIVPLAGDVSEFSLQVIKFDVHGHD